MELPVGGGSDATRVSSYNPWVSMYWLSVGKTVGGLKIYDEETQLSRATALELYTRGSAWFSNEQQKKGDIAVGMFADLAVLNKDYFEVADEAVKSIESIMTIVGGKIVYAKADFSPFSPPEIPVLPDWSPVKTYKGYYATDAGASHQAASVINAVHSCVGSCDVHAHNHNAVRQSNVPVNNFTAFWGALGCSCFAF